MDDMMGMMGMEGMMPPKLPMPSSVGAQCLSSQASDTCASSYCEANETMCKVSWNILTCVPTEKGCPLVCEQGEKLCTDISYNETIMNFTEEQYCVAMWEGCKCTEWENTCFDGDGYPFCSKEPCMLDCKYGECWKTTYNEEGWGIDWEPTCASK